MKLPDWLCPVAPNPDVVGQFRLTREEIEADALLAHARKLRRARAYLRLRKIAVRPLIQAHHHHTKE